MKKILSLFILIVLLSGNSFAQIIYSVAGNGLGGSYTSDGIPATANSFDEPYSIALDSVGNYYFTDDDNYAVRKVGASGIIYTVAGTGVAGYSGDGGPATGAQLNRPHSLAFDHSGNLYISDYLNNVIRKVNTGGMISTIAGTGTAGMSGDGAAAVAAELRTPIGLAIDGSGNLDIADGNNRIRQVNLTTGIITTIAGGGSLTGDGVAATAAALEGPLGITVDGAGNIYITETLNYTVKKITAGIITTVAGNGTLGDSGDGGPATAAQLSGNSSGLAVDGLGDLYIADGDNSKIKKVNTLGIISTVAGVCTCGFSGDGGPATAAGLDRPQGLVFDAWGNLYIVDDFDARIRKIVFPNHPPRFTGGHIQNLTICENSAAANIDTLLAVMDTDSDQPETWSLLSGPYHGTAAIPYSTTSTGSLLIPAGLSYTPASGYGGIDSFRVRIYDGYASDTTTIDVSIPDCTLSANNLHINTGEAVEIYPNPAYNELTVTYSGEINSLAITDLLGQTLISSAYHTSVATLGINDLPAGVYIIKINETVMRKFVKM